MMKQLTKHACDKRIVRFLVVDCRLRSMSWINNGFIIELKQFVLDADHQCFVISSEEIRTPDALVKQNVATEAVLANDE